MFPPPRNIKEKEVALQLMKCFRSFGLFVLVDTVHLVVKEVALTTNESTIFLIYLVCHSLFLCLLTFICDFISQLKLLCSLPAAFVSPSRDALCLGERIMVYLPRCADTNPEVRKTSAQVGNLWWLLFYSVLGIYGFYIVHDRDSAILLSM